MMGRNVGVVRRVDSPAGGPGRLPYLDSLRGVAALMVVAHHAHFECSMTGPLGRATAWMREGHFLVTFFIILSGYCLTLPTLATGRLAGGVGSYLRRRAWRLLPAYYAALAGSLALIALWIGRPTGRHWDFALPVTGPSIASHLGLVHNYEGLHLYQINHVFWSIAVEWQVYFAFPALLWLARKAGVWPATAAALGLGYAGYGWLLGSPHHGLTPHFYGMFAVGMLAATLAHDPRWADVRESVSWWTLAGLALLATAAIGPTATAEVLDLPIGVAGLASLVALARSGRARSWLERRPLVALGEISYSLYLVHAPLQHLLVANVLGPLGLAESLEFPVVLVAGTPLILAVATAFHRLFERPFLPRPGLRAVPTPMGWGRSRAGSVVAAPDESAGKARSSS